MLLNNQIKKEIKKEIKICIETNANKTIPNLLVQLLSCVWLSATPWTAAHQASLSSITNSRSLLKLMSIGSVMPSKHLILCHHLLLQPSIFPSIRSLLISLFFSSGGQSTRASASVHPVSIQDWFPLKGLVGSSWSPRDSQESSTPQFKSISPLALSFLYGLTSIHDY